MTSPLSTSNGYGQLASNTLATLAGRFSAVLLALAVSTVLFRHLGPQAYGVWSFCYVLVGYLTLFDLGLAAAVERLIARAHWSKDRLEMERVIGIAFTLAAAFAVLAQVLVLLPPLQRALSEDARRAALVLPLVLLLSLLSTITGALLSGLQEMRRLNALRTVMGAASGIVLVGLVLAGVRRLDLLLLVHGSGLAGAAILGWQLAGRRAGALRPSLLWDARLARDLARFAGTVQAASFLPQAAEQVFRVVLGMRFGAAAMGFFDLGSRAALVLRSFAIALLVAMVPFGAQQQLAGGRAALGRLYALASKYTALFLLPASAVAMYHSRTLIALWLGESPGAEEVLFVLRVFLAAHALAGLSGPIAMIARSVGLPGAEAVLLPTASTLGIVAALLSRTREAALAAFALATVLGAFALWGWLSRRLALGVPILPVIASVTMMAVAAFFLAFAADVALARFGAQGHWSLAVARVFVSGALSLSTTAGVAWFSGFITPVERSFWRSRGLSGASHVS